LPARSRANLKSSGIPTLRQSDKRGLAIALLGTSVPVQWLKRIEMRDISVDWVTLKTGHNDDPITTAAGYFVVSKEFSRVWHQLSREMTAHLDGLKRGNSYIGALDPIRRGTPTKPSPEHARTSYWDEVDPSGWREQD
jgi:hypothetical protein